MTCGSPTATFGTRVVVGAGGHFCPVARHLRGGGRHRSGPVVAKEAEFDWRTATAASPATLPELFFCRDLEGYGWCVRKGAYLNIGLGRRDNGDLNPHIDDFIDVPRAPRSRRCAPRSSRWRGHAYLASGTGPRPLIVGTGMLVAGDAAGLAYPESGEGIKPAVESGRLAAETLIAAGGRAGVDDLRPYEAALRRRYPAASKTPDALARARSKPLGACCFARALHAPCRDRSLVSAYAQLTRTLKRARYTSTGHGDTEHTLKSLPRT